MAPTAKIAKKPITANNDSVKNAVAIGELRNQRRFDLRLTSLGLGVGGATIGAGAAGFSGGLAGASGNIRAACADEALFAAGCAAA